MAAGRRRFVVALAIALAASIGIATFLERDTRVPLFGSPLTSDQLGEVEERLAAWNVGFEQSPDNVRVEARVRSDVLLRLAMLGVPHAHVVTTGEALAKAGPLTPQSVLDAQAAEGLAGDLSLGLRGLAGVEDARIVIAPARSGAFVDDAASPVSASVRVSMRPGASLSRDALSGIRAFVAAGVPGLAAEHVAILDDRGLALSDEAPQAGAGDLQTSLQTALDAAFGARATIVRVRAIVDSRTHQLRDVRRSPLGEGAIATSRHDERFANERKQYTKTLVSEDRGSDVRDERTDTPAGGVERLSVAVLVDSARGLDVAKIRALSSATIGIDERRGDTIEVDEVPFDRAPAAAAVAPWIGIVWAIAPLALGLAAVVAIVRASTVPVARVVDAVTRRIAIAGATRAVAGFSPTAVRGVLRDEPPHTAAAIISALPTATATAVLELYPPEERAAIVRRMARGVAPIVPDYESIVHRG